MTEAPVRGAVVAVPGTATGFGEGPVWDDRRATLLWLDYAERELLELDPALDSVIRTPLAVDVGAIGLVDDASLIAAVPDGFAWIDRRSGRLSTMANVEPGPLPTRMNDGSCDPAGRFLAGSVGLRLEPGIGALHRLDRHGTTRHLVDGLTVSNGLGWSPDGSTLYLVDSQVGIDAFDYDVASGRLGARRRLISFPPDGGVPDGLTVDTAGFLWVAMFGGGCLRRFAPDGTPDERIELPVTHPTSVAFGGRDLEDLYITSAQAAPGTSDGDDLWAGMLLRCRPGVRGRATARYRPVAR